MTTTNDLSEIFKGGSGDWIGIKRQKLDEMNKLIKSLQEENQKLLTQQGEWDLNKKRGA